MDERCRLPAPCTGEVAGACHLGSHRILIQKSGFIAQPLDLVWLCGNLEHAGALELAVEAKVADRPLDLVEVVVAEAGQDIHLFRPAGLAVRFPVGQARVAETTVSTGCRPPDRLRLHEDDAPFRVPLLREHGSPQSAVASTDDGKIGGGIRREGRVLDRIAQFVEPKHALACLGQRVCDDRGIRKVTLEHDG